MRLMTSEEAHRIADVSSLSYIIDHPSTHEQRKAMLLDSLLDSINDGSALVDGDIEAFYTWRRRGSVFIASSHVVRVSGEGDPELFFGERTSRFVETMKLIAEDQGCRVDDVVLPGTVTLHVGGVVGTLSCYNISVNVGFCA